MLSHLVSVLLVVGAASATADTLPKSGILIASETDFGSTGYDETLYIHRLTTEGPKELYRLTNDAWREFGWADARTLWVMEAGSDVRVLKIVDGALATTIPIPDSSWKKPKPESETLRLVVTKSREAWVVRCASTDAGKCAQHEYLRVDGAAPKLGKKPTAVSTWHVASLYATGRPAFAVAGGKPKGYDVKLQQVTVNNTEVKGAVCRGPTSSATFPTADHDVDFEMRPTKVTWLRSAPPLVRLDGKLTNPIGEVSKEQRYMLDCKETLRDAADFGGGIWGAYRDRSVAEWQKEKAPTVDGTWTLYLGSKAFGTVPGEVIRVAPH